jgi:tRNA U34 5-methylaminomethyl-2-thiouridine-forming methyltransferase MnmC
MKNTIRIITTEDGSHSLLNEQLNETYHSVHGAVQESTHVFIKNGLDFYIDTFLPSTIHILEIGFGTGLNAWLTLERALNKNFTIQYTAIEAFPVEDDIWKQLNYAAASQQLYFESLHQVAWNTWTEITANFRLRKIHTTLQQAELESDHFNLVYFDAFAPGKQPELWTFAMLKKVTDAMQAGSVFVTYSAKGQLKRDLKNLNWQVASLPGPPGKREMVRACKQKV